MLEVRLAFTVVQKRLAESGPLSNPPTIRKKNKTKSTSHRKEVQSKFHQTVHTFSRMASIGWHSLDGIHRVSPLYASIGRAKVRFQE